MLEHAKRGQTKDLGGLGRGEKRKLHYSRKNENHGVYEKSEK